MQITLLCFGHLTAYFGSEPCEMDMPEGSTIRDVAVELERLEPRACQLAQTCRFALNEEYASLDTPLTPDCTVAALPPMSGG